jgi:hypothetical protein
MKIGRYNRHIEDFAKQRRVKSQDIKVLLYLNDVMWGDRETIRYNTALATYTVAVSIKYLYGRQLIKVARVENPFKGINRKYCISQKGREMAKEFINLLNE